ncbi:MAG: PIN domain-containing protein [Candidatus Thorarchaeota archaeon]
MSKVVILVVVDTNFLAVPAQFSVDVFSESERVLEQQVDFVALSSVVNEIRALIDKGKGSDKRAFKVALELVNNCRVVEVEENLSKVDVDNQLIEYTTSVGGVLATNDKGLRERARAGGIPVLFLRGKKRLVLEGEVT